MHIFIYVYIYRYTYLKLDVGIYICIYIHTYIYIYIASTCSEELGLSMLTQAWPRVTWSKRDPTVKSRRSASYEKSRIRTSGMVFVTRSRAALETAVLYRYKAEGGGVESKGPNGQITAKRVL